MAELSYAPDSKLGLRATVTGVRIPLSPPFSIIPCVKKLVSGSLNKNRVRWYEKVFIKTSKGKFTRYF